MTAKQSNENQRAPEREVDLQAHADELGKDALQPIEQSPGHGGELQGLSNFEEASDESVRELADNDQALEAAAVEGVEAAANHPERPVHTHEDYGASDDFPSSQNTDEAA